MEFKKGGNKMNKQEFTTMVTEELQKMAWENGYQIEIEPIP